MVEFAGTKLVVGKGGANTMFWQVGDGERKLGYPNDLLVLLDRLGRQECVAYLHAGRDESERRVLSREAALRFVPESGARIYGVTERGEKVVAYAARSNLSGRMSWMKVGSR